MISLAHKQLDFDYRWAWMVLAVSTGLFVATQPVPVIAVSFFIVAFFLLSAITPLAAVIFLVVLAPMRTLIATEAGFQLPLDIGQLILLMFLGAWLLHFVILKRSLPRLRWSPLFIPLGLFLAVTALTAFRAPSSGAWLSEWLKWGQIFALIAIVHPLASGKRWQWLFAGLLASGVANALVGFYQFFGGSGALHLLIGGHFFRAFGTFGQPNPFAGFMGLLAPLAIAMTLACALMWLKQRQFSHILTMWLYGTVSLVLVGGIIISWSRGSWLAFVAAMIAIMFALPRRLEHGLVLACGLVLAVGVMWASGLLPESVVTRVSSSTAEFFAFEDMRGVDISPENYAVVERLAHWQAALNMARENPWLGIGFGNYAVAYPEYRLINWDEPLGHAHNYYLNILAETGIIGLLAYGKVWLVIMWITWRSRRHPAIITRFVVIGLLGSWTYLLVHSLFDNLYVNNLFLHIGLMLGILSVMYNQVNCNIELRVA